MKTRILLSFVIGIFLYGCSAKQLSYIPTDLGNVTHSIAVVKESLQYQSPNHKVNSVEINHDYIKIVSQPNSKISFIHFDSIGKIELHQKDEWQIVTIRGLDKSVLYRLYVEDDDVAKNFMNAVYTLKNHWQEIEPN